MCKKIYYTLYSVILVVGLSLAGCTSDEPLSDNQEGSAIEGNAPDDEQKPSGSVTPHTIVKTYSFDLNFFKSAVGCFEGNVIVSPFAAHYALGISALASTQSTVSDLVTALKCISPEYLCAFHSEILNSFQSKDYKVVTELSSSLWYASDLSISNSFSDMFSDTYGGRLFPCHISSPDTDEAVSVWCSDHTRKTVTEVAVPDDADIMLLSSLYFKSPWSSSLSNDIYRSPVGVWYGDSGETECSMVNLMGFMAHASLCGGSYDAVKVDLANGSFTATFVLPDKGSDISDFFDSVNYRNLINKDARDLEGTPIWNSKWTHLSLPVFDTPSSAYDLSQVFDKMGIGDIVSGAFDNFDCLTEGANIHLSQTATLEFSDEGVESAAVSQGIHTTANLSFGDDSDGEWMEINRPYIFFIHDNETDVCILAGRVTDL